MMTTDILCKNCNQPVQNKYCSHCGQKTSTARISFAHLFHELIHGIFHIDHGFLFTARELLIRPGIMVKNYLAGHRVRYFNPFTFCVIIGGVNAYLLQKVHWQGLFIDLDILNKKDVHQEVWNVSLKYFTYRLLLSIPFLSLVTYFFYYKKHYLFIEHLIANTYLRAEFWLFMIISEPMELLGNVHEMAVVTRLIFLAGGITYMGWAYAGLFGGPLTARSFGKGIFVALTGTLLEMAMMNILIRFF